MEKAQEKVKVATQSSPKEIIEALLAIGILNNFYVQDIFHLYLSQKRLYILDLLVVDETGVQPKLSTFIHTLQSIADNIIAVFHSDSINQFISHQTQSEQMTMSMFTKMYSENSNAGLLFRYLPSSIKNATFTLNPGMPLSPNSVIEYSTNWIASMNSPIQERITLLIAQVKSVAHLDECRKEILHLESISSKNIGVVFGDRANLWNFFFEKVFLDRSRLVLAHSFTTLFSYAASQIENLISLDHLDENDLAKFIWFKQIDGTQRFANDLSNLMYTPALAGLLASFQSFSKKMRLEIDPILNLGESTDYVHTEFLKCWEAYQVQLLDRLSQIKHDKNQESRLMVRNSLLIGKAAQVLASQVEIMALSFKKNPSLPSDNRLTNFDNIILASHSLWIISIATSASVILLNGMSSLDWSSEKHFQFVESIKSEDGIALEFPIFPSIYISQFLHFICEAINRIEAFSMNKVYILFLKQRFVLMPLRRSCSSGLEIRSLPFLRKRYLFAIMGRFNFITTTRFF